MSESNSTRRKFLKIFGITAGVTLISPLSTAANLDQSEIKKLNNEQQEFIILHEKWMDEFIEVIRVQKIDPEDRVNNKMIAITEQADEFRPKLNEFMKDGVFALIYKMSLERMSKEI